MDEQTKQSLDRVCEYLYVDEKRNMEELAVSAAGNDGGEIVRKNHIFNDVRRLVEWLHANGKAKKLKVNHGTPRDEKKTYAFITSKSFRIEVVAHTPYEAYALVMRLEGSIDPKTKEQRGVPTQSYYEYVNGLCAVNNVKHL